MYHFFFKFVFLDFFHSSNTKSKFSTENSKDCLKKNIPKRRNLQHLSRQIYRCKTPHFSTQLSTPQFHVCTTWFPTQLSTRQRNNVVLNATQFSTRLSMRHGPQRNNTTTRRRGSQRDTQHAALKTQQSSAFLDIRCDQDTVTKRCL